MSPDFTKILDLSNSYKPAMSAFLIDMVAIFSERRNEKAIIHRIKMLLFPTFTLISTEA
jgi:hypothetical protein